jgi:hypothetical protein
VVKVKFTLEQATKVHRGSLTSGLNGVGGQRHAPAALTPGKTRYPLYRRLGGPQGLSGRVRKISPPNGIRSPNRSARSEWPYRLSHPGPHFPYHHMVIYQSTLSANGKEQTHSVGYICLCSPQFVMAVSPSNISGYYLSRHIQR